MENIKRVEFIAVSSLTVHFVTTTFIHVIGAQAVATKFNICATEKLRFES